MKVIFLDIDGVMNTEAGIMKFHKLYDEGKMSIDEYIYEHDLPGDEHMLPLKHILEATDAKIVLSSSWRVMPRCLKKITERFNKYNIKIYDRTCEYVKVADLIKCGFSPENCWDRKYLYPDEEMLQTGDRGAEIGLWLHDHPDVESFVIFDDEDMDIIPYFPNNYIKTDFYGEGLNMKLANKAIEILNKEK